MAMKRLCMTLLLLATLVVGMNADVKKVVFAGDGVTDGAWGRSKGAATAASSRNLGDQNHHLGDSYVFLCAAWYQSQYPTLGLNIQNRGITGNTLNDLSSRWQADILSLNPDMISVLIGAKDVDNYIGSGASGDFDVETWTSTYRSMLQQARAANANVKLVLCAPFAGSKATEYDKRKTLLSQLAGKVAELAAEFDAVYVPFDELFASEPSEGCFLWDGTLPSVAGHYRMFKMWVEKADASILGSTSAKSIGPSVTQQAKGKRRLLFIGDSITDAGWGLAGGSALTTAQRNQTALDHIMGHGYAMLCAAWYQSAYPETGYDVLNRGISGNTLANLASRWQTDVLDLNPDVLSVLIGTNDIDQWLKGSRSDDFDYDAWETQYRSLLNQVLEKNPKVQLVLCTPFVGSRSSDYDTRRTMVAGCAARVKKIAADLGAACIPFDELFATLTQNQPNTAYWIWDGIHPSPAGHYKMFEQWMETAGNLVFADAKKAESTELQTGGQFMDLLLPMEGNVPATEADWGTTSGDRNGETWDGTLGRWKDNGIEDTERSYWGGNIIKGEDGKYHIYVAGWPSATCGHMQWSSKSRVYHVVSDNVWGPYTYVSDIGSGHNPEIYKTGDTYVIYRIEPLGYYKSSALGDSWEKGEYTFDLRDRAIIAGDNRETSLSNCTFAKREDGSFVMMDRGGGIWVSRDGLADPWHHLTDASVYLNGRVTTRGSLEDPVIWRDHLQYHMVVNDWRARYAYYYRSKDGLHWTMETGKAYTGQDPFAKHTDGTVEKWHKYERPRVYQDETGRAVRMNFAVIDCVKQSDLAGDTHSSKNINMPVTRQLLLEVQGSETITAQTTAIRVLVKAEDGFNPRTDLNLPTLKFGSHEKVNFGNGFSYSSAENSGDSDLLITFTGEPGESGITSGEWAPKLLGKKTDGSIAFGYARLPYVNYQPAMLSAVMPVVDSNNMLSQVKIENFGQTASAPASLKILDQNGRVLAEGTAASIEPYASAMVALTATRRVAGGTSKVVVVFSQDGKETDRNTLSAAAIVANQEMLKALTDSAAHLLQRADYVNGREALQTAKSDAEQYLDRFSVEETAAAIAAMKKAIRNFLFANGNVTENYDFYSWAMTSGATLYMTDKTVSVTDGANTVSVPVADRVTDGSTTQYFNGRVAFSQGSSNFNLRNNGVNNASSGLFDYNKDSYFSVLNLQPGDKITLRVTGLAATFVSQNVYLQSDATQTPVARGSEVTSDATYVVIGEEGTRVQVDIKGVHYTTIKLLNVETSEKERISAPSCRVTGASYHRRTVTIDPGIGTAGTEAEATYYTLDGTPPDTQSKLYTAPFVIEETTTVKAISLLPDNTASEVSTTVVAAGTTLSLNTPVFRLTSLSGDDNAPLVDVDCDNSTVVGHPETTMVYRFNGTEVDIPFLFPAYGTLTAIAHAEGYEEAEASVTLAGTYRQQQYIDYSAITADNIASVLGSSWTVGTDPTRWAYWSTGDTYYVAATSATGNVPLGDFVMTDQGKSLLMNYGVGRNTTNGETRFWISSPAEGSIACYEVNETRDKSGILTPYYVFGTSDLAFSLFTNYTLAHVSVYEPVGVPTAVSPESLDAAAGSRSSSPYFYTLSGQRVSSPRLGIYIRQGKKLVVKSARY